MKCKSFRILNQRMPIIGTASGKGMAILFKKGKKIGTVQEKDFVRILMEEVERL